VPEWEYEEGATYWWPDDRVATRWDEPGFETPEEAAAPEIPQRYKRVVGVNIAPDGAHAVVELLTNEAPQLHPYTVFCERDASGRWHERGGHNRPA
jgi:hypothetical protein